MELMVVVVVIGIVAAFGIPDYQRSVNTSIAKDAVSNLKVIAAAQQLYLTRNSSYHPSAGTANVASLNQSLHINILEQQGVVYTCTGGVCSAARASSGWTYSITMPATLPVCSAGTCPYTPTF